MNNISNFIRFDLANYLGGANLWICAFMMGASGIGLLLLARRAYSNNLDSTETLPNSIALLGWIGWWVEMLFVYVYIDSVPYWKTLIIDLFGTCGVLATALFLHRRDHKDIIPNFGIIIGSILFLLSWCLIGKLIPAESIFIKCVIAGPSTLVTVIGFLCVAYVAANRYSQLATAIWATLVPYALFQLPAYFILVIAPELAASDGSRIFLLSFLAVGKLSMISIFISILSIELWGAEVAARSMLKRVTKAFQIGIWLLFIVIQLTRLASQ